MSSCVIPVAPEFDDPEQNYPPYIIAADPGEGSIFTPGATPDDRDLTVTLADQNLNDNLFVRWIFDYPGFDRNVTRLAPPIEYPPTGKVARGAIHFAPNCLSPTLAGGLTQHRLMLSVSDRQFLDAENGDSVSPDAPLDSVPVGANRIRAVWILNLTCK